jgi:hypothetical protein
MKIKYTEKEKANIRAQARQMATDFLAKQERKVITEDDILNIKIAVNGTDVNDFINQM